MRASCLPNVSTQREDLPPWDVPAMLLSYIEYLKALALIDRYFPSLPGVKITQCVCIGLGNITRPFRHLESVGHAAGLGKRNDSLLQLAALYIILELLAETHAVENVYFQDPNFTDFEESFLRGQGYNIVYDPEAFNLVDSTTFLFAPVVAGFIGAKALEHASPALYIGNCINSTMKSVSDPDLSYDPEERKLILKALRRFRKETVALDIPFCKQYWLGSGSARMLLPEEETSSGSEEE